MKRELKTLRIACGVQRLDDPCKYAIYIPAALSISVCNVCFELQYEMKIQAKQKTPRDRARTELLLVNIFVFVRACSHLRMSISVSNIPRSSRVLLSIAICLKIIIMHLNARSLLKNLDQLNLLLLNLKKSFSVLGMSETYRVCFRACKYHRLQFCL